MSINLTHPKYRADIDGIRAIAILLVVAFHAFGLKGGFIGVDIFFVISGFLISTIIFNNLDSASFSFAQFYLRRVKRIFPALLFMLFVCLVFGWFVLFSDEYQQLGKHLFYGTAFISNFAFLKESGYFDNAAETKPLLHLWSLAIEEQFYIIWPFLIWAAWKRRFNLLAIITLITLSSFIFSINKIQDNKIAAFYLPQSRFWELLIGSTLSYLVIYKKNIFLNSRNRIDSLLNKIIFSTKQKTRGAVLADFLAILGASLVFFGVVFINRDKDFPGFWALLPTLGTAFVIVAGSKAWFNRVILQNKVLVWFGLISFPLYLWHWPILAFTAIIKGETPSISVRIFAVIASIILAWLTYRFVEKPIRFGKNNNDKKVIIFLVSLMILVGFVGYVCFKKDGMPTRKYVADLERQDEVRRPEKTLISDGSCDDLNLNLGKLICLKNSKQPEILIVGDSHAMSLNSSAYLGVVKLKTLLIAQHACVPFLHYGVIREGKEFKECHNLGEIAVLISNKVKSIKTIIIHTNGSYYRNQKDFNSKPKREIFSFKKNVSQTQEEMFLDGYNDIILEFIASGKKVIFIIDNPKLDFDPKSCVKRPPFPLQNNCTISKKTVLEKQFYYRELIKEIAEQNPKLKIFDSLETFCDDNFCYGKDTNNIFYWDDNHLSVSGSKKLLNDLIKSGLLYKRTPNH